MDPENSSGADDLSGFAAVIRFDGAPVDTRMLARMLDAIDYRGPDGRREWTNGQAAIGHLMLHTTAESLSETQPLTSQDDSFVLAMDGWLANRDELRSDLVARGARLRTDTDAELVLRAYETWGDDCPCHLDGEYAFVLWDGARREGFCARDHAGMRPLHYHSDGRRLVVASDLAGVLAAADFEHRPNRDMIAEHLANQWFSRDETLWQGVMRMLPAHSMRVGPSGHRLRRYWMPPFEAKLRYAKDEEYYAHYRDLLSDCVRRTSRSHLPLSCEVSGGLDSSGVFAAAHYLNLAGRLQAPSLTGYTYNFGAHTTLEVDEIEYGRAVAEHLGVPLCEVLPFLPELEWFLERGQLDRDMPPYPNAAMARNIGLTAIENGSRVVLNGEGGDEFLTGNALYYADQITAGEWRDFAESFAADRAVFGLRATIGRVMRYGVANALPLSVRQWGRRRRRFKLQDRFGSAYEWLAPDLRQRLVRRKQTVDQQTFDGIRSPARRGMFMSLQDGFLGYAHEYMSRNAARTGYELRSPMYAREFIEFTFAIPSQLRMRGGVRKFIHVEAMRGMLPDKVLRRRSDVRFNLPFERHLDTLASPMVGSILRCSSDLVGPSGLAGLCGMYRDRQHTSSPMYELWGVVGCNNLFRLSPNQGLARGDLAKMATSSSKRISKRPYAAPSLVLYGSVRDLTGTNSGALAGDGSTMMP